MKDVTLVVMAAGMGRRFGTGIKQLEPVGPDNELLIDYSIYDSLAAGFSKIIFIIRKDLEQDFKDRIGDRIASVTDVHYVFQEIDDIPLEYRDLAENRDKPWGTGQAVLCCKDLVQEPFLVINADDYYGKEAYRLAYEELVSESFHENEKSACMVAFILGNTLSAHGTVTRGICKVSDQNILLEVKETYEIRRADLVAKATSGGEELTLPLDARVSMNMWGFNPGIFKMLEAGFASYLDKVRHGQVQGEYLLPVIVGELIEKKAMEVTVLSSLDNWFGVTYQEDKEPVKKAIQKLIDEGVYPEKLYTAGE